MICTTDFIDIFGFLIVIFFGAIFSGLLPAGAFFSPLGRAWGVFFLRAFARNSIFFVALRTTDFISALLIFSKYLLMIFGNFRGCFFRAICSPPFVHRRGGAIFRTNFGVIF
jgi:hypothetical protein